MPNIYPFIILILGILILTVVLRHRRIQDRQRLYQKWKQEGDYALQINLLFQSEDVEGFIAQGVPWGEYLTEAEDIAETVFTAGKQNDAHYILKVLIQVWRQSFELDSDQMALRAVALQKLAKDIAEIEQRA